MLHSAIKTAIRERYRISKQPEFYVEPNKFFDILDRYSISYGKEKGTSSDEDVPLCGLWVTTKEHQTRVQTFPIFPKGFQVLT